MSSFQITVVESGLKGILEVSPFLSSSFPKQEVTDFASPTILAIMYHHRPKARTPPITDWNLWHLSLNKPFLFQSWPTRMFAVLMESCLVQWLTFIPCMDSLELETRYICQHVCLPNWSVFSTATHYPSPVFKQTFHSPFSFYWIFTKSKILSLCIICFTPISLFYISGLVFHGF